MSISLVIPFYNEASRIGSLADELIQTIHQNDAIQGLILVDDGSTDETVTQLKAIQSTIQSRMKEVQVQVHQVHPNQGKGNALREGISLVDTQWVCTIDADLAIHPNHLKMWDETNQVDFQEPNKVYIGSRYMKSHQMEYQYKRSRKLFGKLFGIAVRMLTGLKIQDTQCGFKLYPTPIAKKIFSNLKEKGFVFDVEILIRLKKNGIPITALPVHCINTGSSTVRPLKHGWQMLKGLIRIRKI